MLAIYKREVRSYFQSMVGCVFVAFLIAFTGIYFMAYNLTAGYPYFSYTLSGTLIVFIVGIPLITMRSFSEERKNKTDQLLLTAPVSLWKVVLGKYLAMVTVIGIPNVIFCAFPLIIKAQGTAYLKVDYIHRGILPVGLCICGNRHVPVCSDGKSDDRIYQYIWYSAYLVSLEWNSFHASKQCSQRIGRCDYYSDSDCCLYLSDDRKYSDCRCDRSSWCDRRCGCVLCEIKSL